jgi:hypothetical protein
LVLFGITLSAQQAAQNAAPAAPAVARAGSPVPLAYRQEWKSATKFTTQELVSQAWVANPNLELKMYGAYKPEGLLFTHHFPEEPAHIWNGLCSPTCAVAFREKDNYVDLTGLAKIRWITMINGLHQIRIVIKLADGTWLMSDQTTGYSSDYRVSEFVVRDIRWKHLDMDKVVEHSDGKWFDAPDLSKVDEIGWTDMTPGVAHGRGGWSDVGWMEVYGKLVKRSSTSNN